LAAVIVVETLSKEIGSDLPICFLPSSRIAPSVSSSIGEQILALRDGAGVPPKSNEATLKADSIAQINVKHVSPAPLGLDHLNLLDQRNSRFEQ
jgi:hypothetical protein